MTKMKATHGLAALVPAATAQGASTADGLLSLKSPRSTQDTKDAAGQTWLGYNDPMFLARRHGIASCPVAANLIKALSGIAEAAVAP